MTDLGLLPVRELARLIRTRELGAVELLEHYLQRIEAHNPAVNAVVTLDEDGARAAARRADDRAAGDQWDGPLHGIPITIKDCICTAGMRTTVGASELESYVPQTDATAVARLRAAGAIVFGKTNLPAWAAQPQTHNALFGVTNNPYDPTRTVGGSSGGAAAAVAAGLTALDIGSDLLSSIRNPAHYCGVFGHKPSYGVVPLDGHIPPPPGVTMEMDFAVLGPLARSADDLALALDVMAAPDAARAAAWRIELPRARPALRVATWFEDPRCPVDPDCADRLDEAVAALGAAGYDVARETHPDVTLGEFERVLQRLVQGMMAAFMSEDAYRDAVAHAASSDAHDNHTLWTRDVSSSARDWSIASNRRHELRAMFAQFFEEYDVLLVPTCPTAAFRHNFDDPQLDDVAVWSTIAGVAWLPATVAPVGRTREGLPVGVQIVGPFLEDHTTIHAARVMGDATGGYTTPPGFQKRTRLG
jgi:amidase